MTEGHPASDGATPSELLALAEDAARMAADLVRERVGSAMTMETKSSSVDMVTEVDRAAESLIVERILAERPDDSIVGEEGTGISGGSRVSWVIDPIDGTTNFVYNYPGFGVSIAARLDGVTVAGAVVDIMHRSPTAASTPTPDSGDMYSAALGGGAFRNGLPISASSVAELDVALIATGFSFDSARRGRQAQVLTKVIPLVRDIRRQGSAAVDLCSVACGRVDAYYEFGLNDWDLAAGALIASEAGAVVEVRPVGAATFTLASAPGISTELRGLLDASGAVEG